MSPTFLRDIEADSVFFPTVHKVGSLTLDVWVVAFGLNSGVVTLCLIHVDQSRFIIFVRKHGFPLDKFTYLKYIYVTRKNICVH